jgi:hypothetical protein
LYSVPQYSVSLGNEKPESLQRVEKALWSSLVSIASGLSTIEGLNKFCSSYHEIRDSYPPSSLSLDWFARGKQQSHPHMLLTLYFNLDPSVGRIEVVGNTSQMEQESREEGEAVGNMDKGKLSRLCLSKYQCS